MARRKQGSILPLELALLEAVIHLERRQDPAYGIALARHLADGDDRALIAHGTLYKALGRLTERGMLESSWEDPEAAEAEGRPRRRLYRVTAVGAAAAEGARAEEAARAAAARAAGTAGGAGSAVTARTAAGRTAPTGWALP